ncbi:MAG: hypothetical protein A3D49_00445 [Candidatus Zambryskibacteria bacterium RIFCSPHIGHO2_02_FULL_43_37]|uniref:Uncharacterized protein n=1 Tax=Candidatus Zambryskibacteria bacterium RIFCSPHIGHO2_02_FULL_43_37 TaxID=1802749 RepID=A0A1G2TI56_9BACT|nr:MAG: hypothetical protein A3D49_00445 [Candidatus Zambryskibacteria bacterium RIFCSPHIGHO2_02_FULL_43_37]
MNKEEATFTAFPLFAQQRAGAYSWRANSGEPSGGNTVTYRAPEGASGVSRVNVSFSDGNAIMRPIERSFLIQFGNE